MDPVERLAADLLRASRASQHRVDAPAPSPLTADGLADAFAALAAGARNAASALQEFGESVESDHPERSQEPVTAAQMAAYRHRPTLLHAGYDSAHAAYCRVDRCLVGHYAEHEPYCPLFCACGNVFLATPETEEKGAWRCPECGMWFRELPQWDQSA